MPRLADPALEVRIVTAALRLLDRGGDAAVTLRAVAKEAKTTTPTIYQRFRDREELLAAMVDRATDEIVALLLPTESVEALFRGFVGYALGHPLRMGLMVETFGKRFAAEEAMPALELLIERLEGQRGIGGRQGEDLGLAIAVLAIGTALGMIAAGSETRHAGQLREAAEVALTMLLEAFVPKREEGVAKKRKRARAGS